jgi:D-alanyl-D-alanine dipeptidase
VTKILWDATRPEQRNFVADPAKGSRHNRGCAVDLTLYELATGRAVEMPSVYDEFSERSHPDYAGGTAEQRRLRDLLRSAMEARGFTVYEHEWWHFDHEDWQKYPVLNLRFEEIGKQKGQSHGMSYSMPAEPLPQLPTWGNEARTR